MFPDLTRDDVFRIETKRLWLRWPRIQDATAIQRLAGNAAVAEMTSTIPHPYPKGAAERFIFEARKDNAIGARLTFAIAPRNRPEYLMGVISARNMANGPNQTRRCDIGYWLGEPHWGEGFATEAAHGLIDAVFSFTDIQEIEARARVINPASRGVIEKCGFKFIGSDMADLKSLRGAVPVDRFLLTRPIWTSLKGWREPRVEIDRRSTPAQEQFEACA